MTRRFTIEPAKDAKDLRTAAMLFEAYGASLPIALDYQDFDTELAGLPGHYAPPLGSLLLARDETGAALGCVGIRPLEEGVCEMKRLYLLPVGRGIGVGRALADAAVAEARRLGHRELRLDTLPMMTRAIAMYQEMGFTAIEPYYAPTPEGTAFLSLAL